GGHTADRQRKALRGKPVILQLEIDRRRRPRAQRDGRVVGQEKEPFDVRLVLFRLCCDAAGGRKREDSTKQSDNAISHGNSSRRNADGSAVRKDPSPAAPKWLGVLQDGPCISFVPGPESIHFREIFWTAAPRCKSAQVIPAERSASPPRPPEAPTLPAGRQSPTRSMPAVP